MSVQNQTFINRNLPSEAAAGPKPQAETKQFRVRDFLKDHPIPEGMRFTVANHAWIALTQGKQGFAPETPSPMEARVVEFLKLIEDVCKEEVPPDYAIQCFKEDFENSERKIFPHSNKFHLLKTALHETEHALKKAAKEPGKYNAEKLIELHVLLNLEIWKLAPTETEKKRFEKSPFMTSAELKAEAARHAAIGQITLGLLALVLGGIAFLFLSSRPSGQLVPAKLKPVTNPGPLPLQPQKCGIKIDSAMKCLDREAAKNAASELAGMHHKNNGNIYKEKDPSLYYVQTDRDIELENSYAIELISKGGHVHVKNQKDALIPRYIFAHKEVELEKVDSYGKIESENSYIKAAKCILADVKAHQGIDLVDSSARTLTSSSGYVHVKNAEKKRIGTISAPTEVKLEGVSSNTITTMGLVDLKNTSAGEVVCGYRATLSKSTVNKLTMNISELGYLDLDKNSRVNTIIIKGPKQTLDFFGYGRDKSLGLYITGVDRLPQIDYEKDYYRMSSKKDENGAYTVSFNPIQ